MKIKAFFFANKDLFFNILYKNFLGTPCLRQLHGGREKAISSVHVQSLSLIVFFQKAVQKCMNSQVHVSLFFSEGSAEVYEQPCACQLSFFLKPVQKCMHQQTFVAQNNFRRMPGQEEMVATVAKIFRAHCPAGGPATITFLQADPEQIIEKLEPVIKDLAMLKEVRKTTKF